MSTGYASENGDWPGENMSSSRPQQQQASTKQLQKTQAQVDEVVEIMKTNVDKVLERDHNISMMENKSEVLTDGAKQFVQQTDKLKKKFWMKNIKMIAIMGGVLLLTMIFLIVKLSPSASATPAPPTTAAPAPTTVASALKTTISSGTNTHG